jgi:PTS system cellobiose-specific IIC component
MEKFQALIESTLMPLAQKLSTNKYLRAISNGFSALLPIILVGAIFTLLVNLQIAPYQSFITASGIKGILNYVPAVTTNLMAVYAVYLIGKSLADQIPEIQSQSTIVGIICLFVFFLVLPVSVSGNWTLQTGEQIKVTVAGYATTYLGAAGLFTSMIIGLIVPTIYAFLIKHNVYIRMPASVPSQITISFMGVIPAMIIGCIFALVRFGFSQTSWGEVNAFIYSILKTPLAALSANPITFMLLIAMCSLMWFFGIHGGMVVMSFLNILYQQPAMENLAAYAAGSPLPNMITKSWWFVYASLGGAGGTLGLCILLFFVAKSNRYKALGKIALPAGLCGINEPITFGLPVVLNVVMFIPFLLCPLITFTLSYVVTSLGIVPFLNGTEIATGTPVIFSGLLCGGWRVALWQIFLIVVQMCIYFPFFRVLDKQALEEEKNAPVEE